MEDIPTKSTGDQLTAAEWNNVPDELENAITDTGIALTGLDLHQLSKTISNYVGSGDFYSESGIANAYVLGVIGSKKAPTAYVVGMRVRFVPGNSNTGASTVNVASLGLLDVKDINGNDVIAGEINQGVAVEMYFDGTNMVLYQNGTKVPQEDFTNIIIGGEFGKNPFQRGDTFSSPIATDTHIADRFKYQQSGTLSVQSSAPTSNTPPVSLFGKFSSRHLKIEVTSALAAPAATDFSRLVQEIEGFNWASIAQTSYIVAFAIYATATGIYSIYFQNVDATISFVSEFTVDTTLTWEKKLITVPASPSAGNWNYTNGRGAQFGIVLAAGSNLQTGVLDTWQTANVTASNNQINAVGTNSNVIELEFISINKGSTPTAQIRSREEELALCQRYYTKTYNIDVFPGATSDLGALRGRSDSGGNAGGINTDFSFPVTMRDTPTISTWAPDGVADRWLEVNTTNHHTVEERYAGQRGVFLSNNASIETNKTFNIHAVAEAEIT